MKNILIPTDFSKCAQKALDFALELAVEQNAGLVLYHSITPVYTADTNFYAVNYLDDYYKTKQDKLRQLLKKSISSNPRYAAIKTKIAFDFGLTAENIVDAASKYKADLIVMGTQGASGLKEFLFGSTAGWVIAKSNVPVLVVPATAKYVHLKAPYLYATDFATFANRNSIKVLEELGAGQDNKIKVLHVMEGKMNDTDEKGVSKMKNKLKNINYDIQFIQDNDIPKAINKYAHSVKAGMLVMVAHHYNLFERLLFESLTKKVSFHTNIPLLVMVKE